MRPGPDDVTLAGSYQLTPRVQSWLDGQLLADDVPVVNAQLFSTRADPVPHQLRLSVPAGPGWTPDHPEHPLACYGQQLSAQLTVDGGGGADTVQLGRYVVQGYARRGDVVDVEALDLTQLLYDYRLLRPRQPPSGATYSSELRALVAGTLPLTFDPALTDRPLPRGMGAEWVEDRYRAIADVLTAWPAQLDVDPHGIAVVHPEPQLTTPVRTWQHGTAGAHVRVEHEQLRDEVYNAVVARGTTEDGADVSGVAYDDTPGSPTRWGGPFGRRPRFYFSPVLDSAADCRRAAGTVLNRELARARQVVVVAPPDPRLQLGDTVRVVGPETDVTGLLLAVRLPLTAGEGPATYTVSAGRSP